MTAQTWPGPRNPCTRFSGEARIASSAGGTSTWETSSETLFNFSSRARHASMALAGAVVSKPMAKKTTCFAGFARAIFRQSSGEYTTRTSPPSDLMVKRSPLEPGTRSMSPNEQKMTFGRRAIACARSIISSGVTHTGHPGPCTSSTPSGRSWSSPFLTMEWVWPPQTSISTQGRVWMRRISATILAATSPSRYSSRYFIAVAPLGRRDQDRGIRILDLVDDGRLQFRELVQFLQRLVGPLGLCLIHLADGEADVHQDILAGLRLRHILQAGFARDAAELHSCHAQPVLVVGVDHFTGYRQTHRSPLFLFVPPQRFAGDDSLSQRNPTVVCGNKGVQEYSKAATPQLYYCTLQKEKILEGPAAQADAIQSICASDTAAHLDNGCGQSVVEPGRYLLRRSAPGEVAGNGADGCTQIQDHRVATGGVERIGVGEGPVFPPSECG